MNKFQKNIHDQIQSHVYTIESIPMEWSQKGVAYIGLSFEYFNIEQDELGMNLLSKIPTDFFSSHMTDHLKTNKDFLEVTLLLVDLMMKSSFVKKDSTLMMAFFKLKGQTYGTA